jgi:O-antigen ligase
MAFSSHGLALALLSLCTLLAVAALRRTGGRVPFLSTGVATAFLSIVQVLLKSTGALVYGIFALPMVLLSRPRTMTRVAAFVALLVATFPITRALDVFPTKGILDLSRTLAGDERTASLEFRFVNEDILLGKALERRWFGWGGYGRNRIYDPETGNDLSVVDGFWVGVVGTQGILGFATYFCLLLIPLFGATKACASIGFPSDAILYGTLALIVALMSLDLLPNGCFNSLPFFLAGALHGFGNSLKNAHDSDRPHAAPAPRLHRRPQALRALPPPS